MLACWSGIGHCFHCSTNVLISTKHTRSDAQRCKTWFLPMSIGPVLEILGKPDFDSLSFNAWGCKPMAKESSNCSWTGACSTLLPRSFGWRVFCQRLVPQIYYRIAVASMLVASETHHILHVESLISHWFPMVGIVINLIVGVHIPWF